MADGKFYSDKEAEEILKLATRRDGSLGGVSRSELARSAAEIGISEEAFLEAESTYREAQEREADQKAFERDQWRDLGSHLASFLFVGAILLFMDLRDGNLSWSYWPIGIWALVILSETISQSFGGGRDKEFAKWKRKQERRKANPITFDLHEELDSISKEFNIEDEKIRAIRELRERSGLGLKEAKDAVEQYIQTSS